MAQSAKEEKKEQLTGDCGIHSSHLFQTILKYERARADRVNGHFALILMGLPSRPEEGQQRKGIIRALLERVRAADWLGWIDEGTVGILLPNTALQGAQVFMAGIQKHSLADRPTTPYAIYCYPEHWFKEGNSSSPGGRKPALDAPEDFGGALRRIEDTFSRSLPAWKRILDIAGALLGLLLGSPLLLLLSAYIKIVSPGPALFRQKRIGYRAAPFTFLKFRTMCPDNDPSCHRTYLKALINSEEPMGKLDNGRDPRIIPGGRVIRKACLDELPQLLNVLRGEMSLVGPRPCLPYEAEEYLRWHGHRFDVLPGLTGLWQVSGKNKLTFKQMIRLDISYCQNMTLWLDLKILLRTFPTIISLVGEATVNRLKRSSPEPRGEQAAGACPEGRGEGALVKQL